MHDKIKNILEREISRLNVTSTGRGLDESEVRSLISLIKAFQQFIGETPKDSDKSSPAVSPLNELLDGITNE